MESGRERYSVFDVRSSIETHVMNYAAEEYSWNMGKGF